MEVGYSENDKQIILIKVNNSIWKTPDETPSRISLKFRPCPRELLDAIYCEKDLPQKLVTKAASLMIVVVDGFVKFDFGDLKELNFHLALYSARTSSADMVVAAPDL